MFLALEGHTGAQIRAAVGRSRGFTQPWCYRYRDGGIKALKPGRSTGKPPRLKPEKIDAFKARLDAGPTDADSVCTLRGTDIQRILEEEFEAPLSLQGV